MCYVCSDDVTMMKCYRLNQDTNRNKEPLREETWQSWNEQGM